jgi:hypothetical protein
MDENIMTRIDFVLGDVRLLSKNGKTPMETAFHFSGNELGKSGNLLPLFNERQSAKILC